MLALSQAGESQLNPEGKRRRERGAGGRARGAGLHRVHRDSSLARPVRTRRLKSPPAPRAKTCKQQSVTARDSGGSGERGGERLGEVSAQEDALQCGSFCFRFQATPIIQPSKAAVILSCGVRSGSKKAESEPSLSVRCNHAAIEYASCWSRLRPCVGKECFQSAG